MGKEIIIRQVGSRRDRKRLLAIVENIYADDPAWVTPLRAERLQHLSERNPVMDHLERSIWIAEQDGHGVGCVSAQIDRLHLERYGDTTGFFGLLESVDDAAVFRALTSTAERWLEQRGMRRVLGPFSFNINQECGLLVAGFETSPSLMMGHARPYYASRLETCGYRGTQDLLAYVTAPQEEPPRRIKTLRDYTLRKARVRTLRRRRLAEELDTLRDIFNDAWAENWGFVPFTPREFREIGHALLLLGRTELVQIAELDGEAAAFIAMLPNLNEAIRDLDGRLLPLGWMKLLWRLKRRFPHSARVPLMGVRRKYHNTRLGPGLAVALIETLRSSARALGVREVELSWILEQNSAMRNIIEEIGGVVYKRYRLFEKTLATAAGEARAP